MIFLLLLFLYRIQINFIEKMKTNQNNKIVFLFSFIEAIIITNTHLIL